MAKYWLTHNLAITIHVTKSLYRNMFRKCYTSKCYLPVNLICPASSSKMLKIKIHIHQYT